MKKILLIFGTRPEAIKMAPLYTELKKHTNDFDVRICVTAQHREMLDQVLNFFGIIPDYDLDLMTPNQTLAQLTARILTNLEPVLLDFKPDIIFVQGDTTSTFIGALAAFYHQIKVAHLEAGLRSWNKYSPFPEEINRTLTTRIADWHFTPTEQNKINLSNEGIKENVFVVGNTVIDALLLGLDIIGKRGDDDFIKLFNGIDLSKRIILVTGHRRESFGEPFENICNALKEIATNYPDVEIIYPVHLNPNVQDPVRTILKDISNIHLIDPLDYPAMLWLLKISYLVLTDSGGIQEEAPALGKPVLVMREVTERTEGIDAGTAKLVGSDKNKIVHETSLLLDNAVLYSKMSECVNPYGDGTTSQQIAEILKSV
jgi:UDP-N-acetylglucosamine 2-epimerase (non-hydrolysing)